MTNLNHMNSPIKYCRVCEEQLIPDDNWSEGNYTRSQYTCNSCTYKLTIDYRNNNPDKVKAINKKSYNKHRSARQETNKAQGKKHRNTLKGRYSSCHGKAKYRNKKFNLTFEEFCSIITQPCYYCGNNHVPFNGIDRFDNVKGYVKGNCVPCCPECNMMKGTQTYINFVNKCKTIANKSNYHI